MRQRAGASELSKWRNDIPLSSRRRTRRRKSLWCRRGGQEASVSPHKCEGLCLDTRRLRWTDACCALREGKKKKNRGSGCEWKLPTDTPPSHKKIHLCEWERGNEQVKITEREAHETQEVSSRLSFFSFFQAEGSWWKSRKKYLRNEHKVHPRAAAVFCSHRLCFTLGHFCCRIVPSHRRGVATWLGIFEKTLKAWVLIK